MIYDFRRESNQLFPDYQMIKRDNPSQREFEQGFLSDIPIFDNIINESFMRMKRESLGRPPHFRNRLWNAVTMNSNIKGLIIEQYGGLAKVIDGRFCLKLNGKILFFKKVDLKTKMPFHNETITSKKLVNNLATLFETPDPIIWIGYCVDDSWTNLLGIYAESFDGNVVNWITDLSSFGACSTVNYIFNKITPAIDSIQNPLVSIKKETVKVAK